MTVKEKFKNSLSELKNPYSLAALGMLLALRIILGAFANSTLALFGNTVKIHINFLPIAVAAMLFGPFAAGLVGALGDVFAFFLNPIGGSYFPGFTLNGFLTGMILGLFLYKNNAKLLSIILAWLANVVLVEIPLTALWLYITNGMDYGFFLWARLISEAIKFVPSVLIIFAVGKAVTKIPKFK